MGTMGEELPEAPYGDNKYIFLTNGERDWSRRYKTQGYCEAQQDMIGKYLFRLVEGE